MSNSIQVIVTKICTKGIAAKQNADVATDAAHLAGVFKQVGAFWTSRKTADAIELSKTAETAANDLSAAAKAGDEAKMQSSLQEWTRSWRSTGASPAAKVDLWACTPRC